MIILFIESTTFRYEYQASKVYIHFLQNGEFLFKEKMQASENMYGQPIFETTIVSTLINKFSEAKNYTSNENLIKTYKENTESQLNDISSMNQCIFNLFNQFWPNFSYFNYWL